MALNGIGIGIGVSGGAPTFITRQNPTEGRGAAGLRAWRASGKPYGYFLSHKKDHSKFGRISEQISINIHDNLSTLGYDGFMDLDDLSEISKEGLREAVSNSCAMIVLLTDETADSEWCRYEWEVANEFQIPVKCCVDMQRCNKDEVLASIVKTNAYLLKNQWSDWTDRGRRNVLDDLEEWLDQAIPQTSARQ